MVLCYIICSTIRAATDAHSDWKTGLPERKDRGLIYKPVYKLTTAIERQVNRRGRAQNDSPAHLSPARSETSSVYSESTLSQDDSRRRRRRPHPRTMTEDVERELKGSDDPPPPYYGLAAVEAPPRYAQ
ncbi:unnamed protein product [Cutaneotrichosporon oleaginosum]